MQSEKRIPVQVTHAPEDQRLYIEEILRSNNVPHQWDGSDLTAQTPQGDLRIRFESGPTYNRIVEPFPKEALPVGTPTIQGGGMSLPIPSYHSDKPNFTPHVGLNRAQRRAAARKARQGR